MRPRARSALAALAAAVLAAAAGSAAAWDDQGHMATGAVTYDTLERTRPQLVRLILTLMAAHPDRARFDRELGTAQGAARDRLLFEYMARWPDDVRRTTFDHPDWHYALRIVSPAGRLLTFHNGEAESAYLQQLAIAQDPRAAAGDRAVALCWVMHITADMHQPLHAGHWLDARFPATDRAGTIAWVRTAPDAPPIELHQFWDRAGDQPGGERAGAEALAVLIRAHAAVRPLPAPPRAAFDEWAASSRRLALQVAYEDGRFEGATTREAAPVLDPAYVERAHALAVVRLGEAAGRMVEVLSTLPDPPAAAGG